MSECRFNLAWRGYCKKETTEDGDFCEEHSKEKCVSCGKQANKQCEHTGIQFVCGAPLCDDCVHGPFDKNNPGWFALGGGHTTKQQAFEKAKELYPEGDFIYEYFKAMTNETPNP